MYERHACVYTKTQDTQKLESKHFLKFLAPNVGCLGGAMQAIFGERGRGFDPQSSLFSF